jgi:hypothetical protein
MAVQTATCTVVGDSPRVRTPSGAEDGAELDDDGGKEGLVDEGRQ